jgi:hypothetical protein
VPPPVAPIAPGPAHPHPPFDDAGLAGFAQVDADTVRGWRAAGMPTDAAGRTDPFTCLNWLSWGHLELYPALARRWRTYLRWFAPFVAGEDRPRRMRWQRTHRLFLPPNLHLAGLTWWLPTVPDHTGQAVQGEQTLAADGMRTEVEAGFFRLTGATEAPARGEVEVALTPYRALVPGDGDHAALADLLEQVAAEFHYEYREHTPWEYPAAAADPAPRPSTRWAGSCLDCAQTLARLVEARGRPWRLVGGIVAHDAIANPHFWIEVDSTAGWTPLDPSLPAIARMLGADWRPFARAYAGGLDARRVTVAVGDQGRSGVPGGATLGSAIGEAVVTLEGQTRNAWPCLDWVTGECTATFTTVTED